MEYVLTSEISYLVQRKQNNYFTECDLNVLIGKKSNILVLVVQDSLILIIFLLSSNPQGTSCTFPKMFAFLTEINLKRFTIFS